ncbi:RTA1 like protein-domain-containing protein [Dendryphion nanum]|uniref:RTA1 like protein-domain-containing protein n=1 Tax=Dendryphion nanum TaxID=256645 RepID=A0A9P9I7P6_9PLEO|nr:RTA1 like protein-domain-containing protein [Dendryphion nanum]
MSERQYLVAFGPDANCTFALCTIEESVYKYRPSLPANIIFATIFLIAMIVHIVLSIRWKTWWVMSMMIISCVHEIVGYIARVFMWRNPWSFAAFITQIICITQAPVFYCAVIYVMLGQTIDYYAPHLARFSTRITVWIFLPCDIISLILQGVGGSLSASSSGSSQVGVDIAMAGLIFQVITLCTFSSLMIDFIVRFLRLKGTTTIVRRDILFFGFLGTAVALTLGRCLFRAVELREGYNGDLIEHEDLFIGLEGVFIVVVVFCLCVGHPGYAFRKSKEDLQMYHLGSTSIESGVNPIPGSVQENHTT